MSFKICLVNTQGQPLEGYEVEYKTTHGNHTGTTDSNGFVTTQFGVTKLKEVTSYGKTLLQSELPVRPGQIVRLIFD